MRILVNGERRLYKREKHEEDYIRNQLKEEETIRGISLLYRWEGLNYKGRTHDTYKLYGEVISQELLKMVPRFNLINEITRDSSYIVDEHEKAEIRRIEKSENKDINYENKIIREEEEIAKSLCGGNYKYIGKIVDYQVPLKDYNEQNKDISVGKIDILSVCEDEDNPLVFLLELKRPDSNETMLRCVLEGYTYYKVLNKKKLLDDMKEKGLLGQDLEKYRIVVAPLVFKDSQPYKEVEEMGMRFRNELRTLISELNDNERRYESGKRQFFGGIVPYYLIKQDNKYSCHEFVNEYL